MAVKLLFEDNENTPSSILLKNSMHGDNIYFASGNSQVLNKLKSIYNDGDTVFIFLMCHLIISGQLNFITI